MSTAYHNGGYSTGDSLVPPPSLLSRLLSTLPPEIMHWFGRDRHAYSRVERRRGGWNWNWRALASLPHLFVVIWVLVLWWGERWVFWDAVRECEWGRWERWPKEATPHHLIFLADPQIIDPHSYPGRPWPLETFTILHTDNYLKRSYISLQKLLHPDTVFFLGDLFDGGREWKTAKGNTQDPSWASGRRPSGEQAYAETWGKRYGEDFWLHEYDRFGSIFDKYWNVAGAEPGPGQRGRKIISSLPGNHDLGFGEQIKIPIRNRFEVYFGETNRVDVIGNHTFVSVDSVSLSAGDSTHDTKAITQPVNDFLENVQIMKRKAVAKELAFQRGEERLLRAKHIIADLDNVDFDDPPTLDPGPHAPGFPTILLTHVPLFRNVGTPCGPKRERSPPTKPPKGQTQPVNPDEPNAISISKGYQYQNVLSEADSIKLVSSIGNVGLVFSGDDHDYCEIIHSEAKNHARETTVKSMSWAQGVRKPGFQMLSMWNPVGPDGNPLHSTHTGHGSGAATAITTESHLCLLPDQIGIFIRYLILILITFTALIIRAVLTPVLGLTPFSSSSTASQNPDDSTLLPVSQKREPDAHRSSNSSTSSTSSNSKNLAPRSSAARTRSVSPAKGYGLPASQVRFVTPPISQAGYYPNSNGNGNGNGNGWAKEEEDFNSSVQSSGKNKKVDTPLRIIWRETWTSIWRVAWIVMGVYLWLICFYPV
ncbi:Cell division control protein [Lachnellula hyalina]|uniref:Cell division control protein n=1 Tax=Lachnellula hyalina TaxID=1316788 RepID=A0A8H8R7M9_9HELO|nr:Cell division control protein [Lachnellula hyalina]TVY28309.1 Cell division control protein [Lachnellula hyalina]